MSPHPPATTPPRPATTVDQDIRTLLHATGGWLWGPTREQYQQLRDEWVAAVHAEIAEAA